jgi:hypothetical protein
MTVDELQERHEGELARAVAALAGKGRDSDWALVRALVHRAVHLAAERKPAEFCVLASFLAEMIGHAHGLLHPADPQAPGHTGGAMH